MSNHTTFMELPSLVRQTLTDAESDLHRYGNASLDAIAFELIYCHIIAQQEKIDAYETAISAVLERLNDSVPS